MSPDIVMAELFPELKSWGAQGDWTFSTEGRPTVYIYGPWSGKYEVRCPAVGYDKKDQQLREALTELRPLWEREPVSDTETTCACGTCGADDSCGRDFQPGDVVQLRSGGPPMTVAILGTVGVAVGKVVCWYMTPEGPQTAEVPKVVLEHHRPS
jgi:uncharacterized protein YodC (DUF2158 family)